MAIRETNGVRHFIVTPSLSPVVITSLLRFQNIRQEKKSNFRSFSTRRKRTRHVFRSLRGTPLLLNTDTNVIHFKTILSYQMALNPNISGVCCFVGKGLFRLMKLGELVWRQSGFHKATKYEFTSVCWLNENM